MQTEDQQSKRLPDPLGYWMAPLPPLCCTSVYLCGLFFTTEIAEYNTENTEDYVIVSIISSYKPERCCRVRHT